MKVEGRREMIIVTSGVAIISFSIANVLLQLIHDSEVLSLVFVIIIFILAIIASVNMEKRNREKKREDEKESESVI
jgi:ABC-type iron transport system FetAB permease component